MSLNVETIVSLAAYIGGGLAMGLGAIGAAIGEGYTAAQANVAVSRDPKNSGEIFKNMLVGQAVAESASIFALVIAILLLFLDVPTPTLLKAAALFGAAPLGRDQSTCQTGPIRRIGKTGQPHSPAEQSVPGQHPIRAGPASVALDAPVGFQVRLYIDTGAPVGQGRVGHEKRSRPGRCTRVEIVPVWMETTAVSPAIALINTLSPWQSSESGG